MSGFVGSWIRLPFLMAVMTLLSSSHDLSGQLKYDQQREGTVQTFPWPAARSDDSAINNHRKVLRAEVLIRPDTWVRFYEQPTSITEYNSTVSVQHGQRVIATYPVGRMIQHQALRLVHVALLRSGDSGTVVAEYEGGGVGAREGFAILRFSPSGVKLHTLPLTDYGKVVVFKNSPDQVEVWSADPDEDVGSPVADRPYITRTCRWQAQAFLCGTTRRQLGVFTPGGISDPGIEIR
jgi:hypothetical protein